VFQGFHAKTPDFGADYEIDVGKEQEPFQLGAFVKMLKIKDYFQTSQSRSKKMHQQRASLQCRCEER
jgi:hypothetical protein